MSLNGSHSYAQPKGGALLAWRASGLADTPMDAVRQAREHALELARRRAPRAVLDGLAGA